MVTHAMALELPVLLALLLLGAFAAGFAGSLLGLGGGVFLIPFLTLPPMNVEVHTAIGASIVAVVATSTSAASHYVGEHLTNLRLAMFLEVATTLGAVSGAFVATLLGVQELTLAFAAALAYAAAYMALRSEDTARERAGATVGAGADGSGGLNLGGIYVDPEDGATYRYRVRRPAFGFGVSSFAGMVSGLLGIGGGIIKVPAMTSVMKVPMKVAVATSNFMIGVTAAASAFIYYGRGYVDPTISTVVVLGVFAGATLGSKTLARIRSRTLRVAFIPVLLAVSLLMVLRGVGIIAAGA